MMVNGGGKWEFEVRELCMEVLREENGVVVVGGDFDMSGEGEGGVVLIGEGGMGEEVEGVGVGKERDEEVKKFVRELGEGW